MDVAPSSVYVLPTSIVTVVSPVRLMTGTVVSRQVPQIGLLLTVKGEPSLNLFGSELIFVTHHSDIFWLNEALLNILFILVTLLTFQLPMS